VSDVPPDIGILMENLPVNPGTVKSMGKAIMTTLAAVDRSSRGKPEVRFWRSSL
jgi:hypothetical protein